MTNRQQLRNIRRYKKNRRRAERFGGILLVIGFLLVFCSDSEKLSLLGILKVGCSGLVLMGLGVVITNFIDMINKEHPLVYRPKNEESLIDLLPRG